MMGLGVVLTAGTASATEITVWHAWRGEERATLETAADAYSAANPGDRVEVVFVPYEGLGSKVEAAVPRGNGPDLFIFAHERLGTWAQNGVILPVGPANTADPAHAALSSTAHSNTASWGWPLAVKSLALFYNRTLIAEPPDTTDALLALAREWKRADSWAYAWETSSAYQNAAWMHGFGGGVYAAPGRVLLDQPGNVAAFGFIQELARLGPSEPSGALVTQLFNEGRLGMVPNGPWFLGEVGDVDYAVAPLPTVTATGLRAAPWLTVEALFLARSAASGGTPEAEALARGFAAYLNRPEVVAMRSVQGRQVVPGHTPEDAVLAAFAVQAKTAVPMPTTPEMAQTWEPLARALRRLVRGTTTPAGAASEAETTFRIVSRPPAATVDGWPWALGAAGLGVVGGLWAARAAVRARIWTAWREYLWVAPGGLAVMALVVAPFLVGASVSLFEVEGSAADGNYRFVGLTHFMDILLARDFPLSDPSTRSLSFWFTLAFTITWTVVNIALHVSIGVALAMLLREPWVRLRGVFRALLILPWAIPNYITALAWKGMFHQQFGAINAILAALGFAPVSWFATWSTAFAANVTTNTWLGFPFMMVVTLGALQSVPREVEEAAEMDGASAWQRFWLVTLPMLKPALLPAVILGSVWTFNMFNVIYLVSAGEPDGSTDILVSQAYRWAFTRGHRYGYGAAYAVIIFGVMLVQSGVLNRIAGRRVV